MPFKGCDLCGDEKIKNIKLHQEKHCSLRGRNQPLNMEEIKKWQILKEHFDQYGLGSMHFTQKT